MRLPALLRNLRRHQNPPGERGIRAWLDPEVHFSEAWYLENYPDVEAAVRQGVYRNGLEHFLHKGYREGRRPNGLWIDEAWYTHRYPDVASVIDDGSDRDAYEHYLRVGAAEGRDPHAAFDETWYLNRYPDAAQEVADRRYFCGYQHFMDKGLGEGRSPHPEYDEQYYRELHPDVDAKIRGGELACAYLQLLSDGLREGRQWRPSSESRKLREIATELALCRLEELLASEEEIAFAYAEPPRVSVLLVLFNRAELTLKCLESLARCRGVALEVIVVDNGSTDRTRELLERVRGVRCLFNAENTGFVRAANQAAGEATGELLLFLNNDAEVFPSSIRSAVETLSRSPDAGAAGGRVIGLDGKLQEAGSIVWRGATTQGYGRGDSPRSGAYRFPREVDYCSGVFLLTRREVFRELGGFDLRFAPAYYEEADYCFRLRRRGWRVVYDPDAVVVHFGSASLPSEMHCSRMLSRNRPVFLEAHRGELEEAYEAEEGNLWPASDRREFRGRILLLDDHVPLEELGGGSPRMQEILHLLCELGYFVTFFAANPVPLDRRAVRRELSEDNLELIHHLGRPGFADFWKARRRHYDVLIVSRPHNFRELLDAGFDPGSEPVRLIYDAEAVVSRRLSFAREVLGDEAPLPEDEMSLEEEVALARAAQEVWAVTEEEGRLLAGPDQRMSVVPHSAKGAPGARTFEERRGLLFVGRLDEEWNPNVDALRWFLEKIHPLVVDRLGPVRLTVIGRAGHLDLPRPPEVVFAGRVPNLDPIYDEHRLFIAPTRFAAGIPHKVTGAATHGVPVVATSFLARQLGWRDRVELLDGGDGDPGRFADRIATLYRDAALWREIRENALLRVRAEHSREAMKRCLLRALE